MWSERIGFLAALAAGLLVAGCGARKTAYSRVEAPAIDTALAEALDEAVTLIAKGRYEDASASLSRLMGSYERSGDKTHAAEATFWLAYCREKEGRRDEAAALYEHVSKDYSGTAVARPARERLGLLRKEPAPRSQ